MRLVIIFRLIINKILHFIKSCLRKIKIKMLIDYFQDGIAKTSVFGKYPDFGAKNRSISRKGSLNPFNGSDSKKLIEISDPLHQEELIKFIN